MFVSAALDLVNRSFNMVLLCSEALYGSLQGFKLSEGKGTSNIKKSPTYFYKKFLKTLIYSAKTYNKAVKR